MPHDPACAANPITKGQQLMPQLTPEGQRIVEDLARRYGFSNDAVTVMLQAVAAGGGTMAQFDHPEFGGMA